MEENGEEANTCCECFRSFELRSRVDWLGMDVGGKGTLEREFFARN